MAKTLRTPADMLRLMVRNMGDVREDFNDRFTLAELVAIYRAHLLAEWDLSPDQWSPRQVQEAIRGIVPRWTDDGQAVEGGE